MNRVFRRAALLAAGGAAATLITACGGGDGNGNGDGRPSAAATPAASGGTAGAPAPSHSAGEAPAEPPSPAVAELVMGETGRFDDLEPGEGDTPVRRTTFEVTATKARYVTPAEVGAPSPAKNGQYLVLTLTLKNVGSAPGRIGTDGNIQWQNEGTSARAADTRLRAEGPDLDTEYRPGQSVTGSLVLDVGHKGGIVTYSDTGTVPALTLSLPRG
jgi:hypothetical protein